MAFHFHIFHLPGAFSQVGSSAPLAHKHTIIILHWYRLETLCSHGNSARKFRRFVRKDGAVHWLPLPIFFIDVACVPTPFAVLFLFGRVLIKHNQKSSQKGDRRDHALASGTEDLKLIFRSWTQKSSSERCGRALACILPRGINWISTGRELSKTCGYTICHIYLSFDHFHSFHRYLLPSEIQMGFTFHFPRDH